MFTSSLEPLSSRCWQYSVFVVLMFGSVWWLFFSYSAVFGVCRAHLRQCLVFVVLIFGSVWCLSHQISNLSHAEQRDPQGSIYVQTWWCVQELMWNPDQREQVSPVSGTLVGFLSHALFKVDFSYSLSLLKLSWPARRLSVQWSLWRGCDVWLILSGPAWRLTTKKTRCISSDTHALICATYQGAFCVSGAVGVCVCDGVVSGPVSLLSLWLSLLSWSWVMLLWPAVAHVAPPQRPHNKTPMTLTPHPRVVDDCSSTCILSWLVVP